MHNLLHYGLKTKGKVLTYEKGVKSVLLAIDRIDDWAGCLTN